MSVEFAANDITLTSEELTIVARDIYMNALEEMNRRHGPQSPEPKKFHNADHVKHVVASAWLIGNQMTLGERDLALLITGASFHDMVYQFGVERCSNERESAEYAVEQMHSYRGAFHGRDFDRVARGILSTITDFEDDRLKQHPKTWLDMALCDADLAALGDETMTYLEFAHLEHDEREGTPLADMSYEHFLAKQAGILTNYRPHLQKITPLLFPHRQANLDHIAQLQQEEAA